MYDATIAERLSFDPAGQFDLPYERYKIAIR